MKSCLVDVTHSDVRRFLDELGLSARSRYNYCKVLRTYFEFAKKQGYLPKDHDEMEGIEIGSADPGEIEITRTFFMPASGKGSASWGGYTPRPSRVSLSPGRTSAVSSPPGSFGLLTVWPLTVR